MSNEDTIISDQELRDFIGDEELGTLAAAVPENLRGDPRMLIEFGFTNLPYGVFEPLKRAGYFYVGQLALLPADFRIHGIGPSRRDQLNVFMKQLSLKWSQTDVWDTLDPMAGKLVEQKWDKRPALCKKIMRKVYGIPDDVAAPDFKSVIPKKDPNLEVVKFTLYLNPIFAVAVSNDDTLKTDLETEMQKISGTVIRENILSVLDEERGNIPARDENEPAPAENLEAVEFLVSLRHIEAAAVYTSAKLRGQLKERFTESLNVRTAKAVREQLDILVPEAAVPAAAPVGS